jgi:chromatin assembly factor 1 subunit A
MNLLADVIIPERLGSLLRSMPSPITGSGHVGTSDSVRAVMGQLSEAEVTGDTALVRTCLDRLSDRTLLPAKIFIFDEDNRPGYFGTHTKKSSVIKPRKPFNRDAVVLDYTYDSGEEWEGEEEGAGDDVADEDDEDEGDVAEDSNDSDADSWLVDDDDAELDDVGLPDLDRASPFSDISLGGMTIGTQPGPPSFLPAKKRKAVKPEEKGKEEKKRKVVVPLIAYTKGPYWETEVGKCEYDPFEPYRIQLFNGELFRGGWWSDG